MPKVRELGSGDDYKQFLRALEVVGITLIDSQFHIDRSRYFDEEDELISVRFMCDVLTVKPGHFEVLAKMVLKSAKAKAKRGSLALQADYSLHFHTETAVNNKFVQRFAESEARLFVWPYFREYVTSMCGRAQVPPITLPLVGSERRSNA